MIRMKRASLALTATLAITACDPGGLAPLEPIRIGALIDLSGQVVGELGLKMRDSSTLAVEQINASGGLFDGRQVELVFGDTEGDPDKASSEARRLHEDEGVVAFVGPLTSGEVAQTLPVLDGIELTAISPSATNPLLTSQSEWFFRTTPNDLLQGEAIAHLAAKGATLANGTVVQPCAEAALMYRDDSYGTALAEVFRTQYPLRDVGETAFPGRIISDIEFPSTALADDLLDDFVDSFMTNFEAIHAVNVDRVCVFLIAFPDEGGELVRSLEGRLGAYAAATQPGLGIQFYGPDALNQDAFSIASQAFNNILITAPTHADNQGYTEFQKSLRARFSDEVPGNFTFNMYDAVILTGLAITSARSTESIEIRDALFEVASGGTVFEGEFFGTMAEALLSGEDIDYVGPSGVLDFDEDGDVLGDYALHRPIQVDDDLTVQQVGSLALDQFVQ